MENRMSKKEVKAVEKVAETMVEKTEADIIWNDIKNLDLNLYALKNQFVSLHCKPMQVEPTKLYLEFDSYRKGIILPALEELVKNTYNVEQVDRFLVVSKKV
jgi:hypothetical protein